MGVTRYAGTRALTLKDVEPAAELLRSLSSPQRLAIVCTLIEGERAVSELEAELGIRQPSLSQHLGSLREAGIITGRREAKAVFYRVSEPRAAAVVEVLHEIFCAKPREPRAQTSRPASRSGIQPPASTQPASRRGEAAVFARVGEEA